LALTCKPEIGKIDKNMSKLLAKIIEYLFYTLLFFTPLILFPKTSELFEFNKIIATYSLTVLIISAWSIRLLVEKRLIFRRTLLDIPLIVFLVSQILSTIFSIDKRTSLLGFYSRFHGGLASTFSYTLLYWAWVSNMNKKTTISAIKIFLSSAFLVAIWGILEHFGYSFSCLIFPDFKTLDTSCWVQDVKNRVFASFGQPNWLAAWIDAILPITWALLLNENIKEPARRPSILTHQKTGLNSKPQLKRRKQWVWISLSTLFFLTLLYTKSRSGLLAFTISSIVFWFLGLHLISKNYKRVFLQNFLILNSIFFITAALVGTPWTPSIKKLIASSSTTNKEQKTNTSPILEVGGTDSGKIRKIVWKGAIEIWKKYPIFGSGVETFGFSYYNFKPTEHNLTSEWDFLYNKAHNEYLNFAATTGTIGLFSFLLLTFSSLLQISDFWLIKKGSKVLTFLFEKLKSFNPKNSKFDLSQQEEWEISNLKTALASGYVSILVTNFFGFSVVCVALEFFLFPALSISLSETESLSDSENKNFKNDSKKLSKIQKIGIFLILLLTSYFLLLISRYWLADYFYSRGKLQNDAQNFLKGQEFLKKAVKLSPKEAIFWSELANSTTWLSLASQEEDENLARELATIAVKEAEYASSLSPYNVVLKKDLATIYTNLSPISQNYLLSAKKVWEETVKLAPTDAKILFNLSLSYLRLDDYPNAVKVMEKVIELKPDYRNARYTLALMYIDTNEKEKAKKELNYILEVINPNDSEAKKELEELNSK